MYVAEIFDVSGHGLSENALNNIYDDVEEHERLAQSKRDGTNGTVSEWGKREAHMKNELENWTEEEYTSVGIKQCGTVKNVELLLFFFFSFLLRSKATDGYNKCTH